MTRHGFGSRQRCFVDSELACGVHPCVVCPACLINGVAIPKRGSPARQAVCPSAHGPGSSTAWAHRYSMSARVYESTPARECPANRVQDSLGRPGLSGRHGQAGMTRWICKPWRGLSVAPGRRESSPELPHTPANADPPRSSVEGAYPRFFRTLVGFGRWGDNPGTIRRFGQWVHSNRPSNRHARSMPMATARWSPRPRGPEKRLCSRGVAPIWSATPRRRFVATLTGSWS